MTSCHLQQLGGLGATPLNQWVSEAGPLWGGPDKSGGSSGLGLWEDTLKSSGSLARSLGLKNSRSSPSLRWVLAPGGVGGGPPEGTPPDSPAPVQ